MNTINTRVYEQGSMQHYRQRWDDSPPMLATDQYDLNNKLVYELDILHYERGLEFLLVKYGEFVYHNHKMYGWYFEIYTEDKRFKGVKPMYLEVLQESAVIANKKTSKDFFKEVD